MKLLMYRAEVFPVYVGVDLSGRKVGVAQHLLNCPEIGTTFQEMGREAVPKGVRSYPFGDAGPLGSTLHDAPGTYPRERLAARIQEDPPPALPPIQLRPHGVEIDGDSSNHAPADGHESLLPSFPKYSNQILGEQQVTQAQATQLRYAETGSIAELQERSISPGQRFFYAGRAEQDLDLTYR